MTPGGTDQGTQRKRKSVQELFDAVERSGEKFAEQLNSSVLTLAESGSDIFVASVRLLTDIAEAGAERLSSIGAAGLQSSSEPTTPTARIINAQKETLAQAVRIHSQAIKQVAEMAQGSVDRIVSGNTQTAAGSK